MIKAVPVHVIAACFAMCGFALAIMTGLVSSLQAGDALERALLAMLACWIVGSCVAKAAAVAVREHVVAYHAQREIELDASPSIEIGEAVEISNVT